MTLAARITRTKELRKQVLANSTTIGDPMPAAARTIRVKGPKHGLTIAVITDTQVKKGVPLSHLAAAGRYIAAKQPDVIVCIGDFADLESLSTWNKPGSLITEGKRYAEDIDAVHRAMEMLLTPISKVPGYDPTMVLTLGNHEYRILRAIDSDPLHLEGKISLGDLGYENYGWKVIPFLQPITIGGVSFCHFFPSGIMGRPITKARQLLTKLHMSAFAGHQQGRDIAFDQRADGQDMTAIISGSFYQHDEDYLSPLTNRHWRGMYFLHEVKDGHMDAMELSLNYLLRRFG